MELFVKMFGGHFLIGLVECGWVVFVNYKYVCYFILVHTITVNNQEVKYAYMYKEYFCFVCFCFFLGGEGMLKLQVYFGTPGNHVTGHVLKEYNLLKCTNDELSFSYAHICRGWNSQVESPKVFLCVYCEPILKSFDKAEVDFYSTV